LQALSAIWSGLSGATTKTLLSLPDGWYQEYNPLFVAAFLTGISSAVTIS